MEQTIAELLATSQQLMDGPGRHDENKLGGHGTEAPGVEQSQSSEEEEFRVLNNTNRGWTP